MNTAVIKKMVKVLATIFICFSFCVANSYADADTYNQALDAYNKQDYETALSIWRQLATEGNADAKYALGVAYFKGQGVARDLGQSMNWFEQAAKSGNVQAMFNLGAAYWEGNGIRQSYAEAVEWWEKSASADQAAAQYNLGLAYYLGKGAEQDFDKALKWIRKAAENSHGGAQQVLNVLEKQLTENISSPSIPSKDDDMKDQQKVVSSEKENLEPTAASSVSVSSINEPKAAQQRIISAEFQSAIVAGHGGQAYPEQDENSTVLANLAGGTPVKILTLKGDWAEVNVPSVASVWVHGDYIIESNGRHLIKGNRVRARSLPSTNQESIIVGIFEENEPIIFLMNRDQWKEIVAPHRLRFWMQIQQLDIFPEVTSDWLAQWDQAISTPAENVSDDISTVAASQTIREQKAVQSETRQETIFTETVLRYAFVDASSAEVLGADRLGAPLLKLLLRGVPVKIIGRNDDWARVEIPTPMSVWVYGRYVDQKGEIGLIKGNRVRARSMPSTSDSSSILGILENMTPVTIISMEGDWIRVSVADRGSAWRQTEQLEILEQISDEWQDRWTTIRADL